MNDLKKCLKSWPAVVWGGIAKLGILSVLFALLLIFPMALWGAQAHKESPAGQAGQFFIIASVDVRKHQILLKQPTEVTELAVVTDGTIYLDEDGKPMHLTDLRSGDTVYVTLQKGEGNMPAITRLWKGPMTPEELHRRYLNFK